MTVARGVRLNLRRAVVLAAVGLAGAVGALFLVLWLAGSTNAVDVRLGDPDFRGIDASRLANEISRHGPVPFPDLVGRDLPIWVTHMGDDPAVGWSAFSARVPGSPKCLVQWESDQGPVTGRFFNDCDPTEVWPADGAGLETLDWKIVTKQGALELRIDVARSGEGNKP